MKKYGLLLFGFICFTNTILSMKKPLYVKQMERILKGTTKKRIRNLISNDEDKKLFDGGTMREKLGVISRSIKEQSKVAKAIGSSFPTITKFMEIDFKVNRKKEKHFESDRIKKRGFLDFWKEVQHSSIVELIGKVKDLESYKKLYKRLPKKVRRTISIKWIEKNLGNFISLVKTPAKVILYNWAEEDSFPLVFVLENFKGFTQLFGEFTTIEDMQEAVSRFEIVDNAQCPAALSKKLRFLEELIEYEKAIFPHRLRDSLSYLIEDIKECTAQADSKEVANTVICEIPIFKTLVVKLEKKAKLN